MELVKALNLSCFKDKCQTLACIKIHRVLYKGYCTADFCIARAPPGVSGRWEKKTQQEASWKIMKLNFREAIKPNSHEPTLIAAKHTVNISSKEGEQTQVHEYQRAAWRRTSLDTSTSKGCKLGNPGVLQHACSPWPGLAAYASACALLGGGLRPQIQLSQPQTPAPTASASRARLHAG